MVTGARADEGDSDSVYRRPASNVVSSQWVRRAAWLAAVALVFVAASSGVAAGQAGPDAVDQCTTVSSRPADGVVNLTDEVPTGFGDNPGACVEVAADDVVFDGRGNVVRADSTDATGLRVTGRNVTVRNLTVEVGQTGSEELSNVTGVAVAGRDATVRNVSVAIEGDDAFDNSDVGLRGVAVSGANATVVDVESEVLGTFPPRESRGIVTTATATGATVERVTLTESELELRGTGGTVRNVDATASGDFDVPTVDVRGSSTTLDGVTVTEGYGLRVGGTGATVRDVTVEAPTTSATVARIPGTDVTVDGLNVTSGGEVAGTTVSGTDVTVRDGDFGTRQTSVPTTTVEVTGQRVTLDGFAVNGTGSSFFDTTRGVAVAGSNVTLRNGSFVGPAEAGSHAVSVTGPNATVTNTTVREFGGAVVTSGANDTVVRGLAARQNFGSGGSEAAASSVVAFGGGENATLVDSTLVNNTGRIDGVRVTTREARVADTVVRQGGDGGVVLARAGSAAANGSVVENVTVEGYTTGVKLSGALDATVRNSVVNGSGGGDGLGLTGVTRRSRVRDLTVRNNRFGVNATDRRVRGRLGGFRTPRNNTVRNTTAESNDWVVNVGVNATDNDFGGLINQSTPANSDLTFDASGVRVRANETPPGDAPSGQRSARVYFDAEANAPNSYLNVTLQYDDADVTDLNESGIRLYDYVPSNGTWARVDPTGDDTTVDAASNEVTVNVTGFSTFGAFAPPPGTPISSPSAPAGPGPSPGGGGGSDTPVERTCRLIDESGHHDLTRNLTADETCVRITASDVVFDGNGHRIADDGAGPVTYAVLVEPDAAVTNVTVRNLTTTGWWNGVFVGNADSVRLADVTVSGTVRSGVRVAGSSRVRLRGLTVREAGESGVRLDRSRDVTVGNATVVGNGNDGVLVEDTTRTRLETVESRRNGDAVVVTGPAPVRATNLTVGSGATGATLAFAGRQVAVAGAPADLPENDRGEFVGSAVRVRATGDRSFVSLAIRYGTAPTTGRVGAWRLGVDGWTALDADVDQSAGTAAVNLTDSATVGVFAARATTPTATPPPTPAPTPTATPAPTPQPTPAPTQPATQVRERVQAPAGGEEPTFPLLPVAGGGLAAVVATLIVGARLELPVLGPAGERLLAAAGLAGVVVPNPEPEQPTLVVDDVTVTGSPVPGETLRIAATVENVGDLRGGGEVTLERDGAGLETVTVEVDPRADRTVTFEYVVADEDVPRTVRFAVDTEHDREAFEIEGRDA